MLVKEWTLKGLPSGKRQGKEYLEQILISEDGWPFAVVHCDMFYEGKDKDYIYLRLLEGQEVTVEVTFNVIGTDPDDCIDNDDPREEAFTTSERNPSLCRRR